MKFYNKQITSLKLNEVFVFGSNLKGIHGAGAAKLARDKFGAKIGVGLGFTGQAYAIPTKSDPYTVLALQTISSYIVLFGVDAKLNPELEFYITQIGCGLAGYKASQIAPLFKGCNPDNTLFDIEWREYLE